MACDTLFFHSCRTSMWCDDAMHNLLLGTAKNVTRIWCGKGILSSRDMLTIQATINSIVVPVDVGRIPSNVASSFHGFTADQWRNWTCILFSRMLLHQTTCAAGFCSSRQLQYCVRVLSVLMIQMLQISIWFCSAKNLRSYMDLVVVHQTCIYTYT